MLRLAIGRIGQPGEAAFLDVDLGDVILKFAQYLHRLGRGTPALRIKIRLCQLCEIMFQKDHVVLSNGSQVRNALLEWFSDWTQEVIVDGDTSSHSDLGAVERLQHELEVASLRAIVACSDGLVLQPTGSDSQETHGSMKSRLFYRHFQFLSRLLNRPPTKEVSSNRDHICCA
jgi:neurofibromin 1